MRRTVGWDRSGDRRIDGLSLPEAGISGLERIGDRRMVELWPAASAVRGGRSGLLSLTSRTYSFSPVCMHSI
jgi:hypothetical protein